MGPEASLSRVKGGAHRDPLIAINEVLVLSEETLVPDARAGVTPAQMVERKVASLLKGQALPISHIIAARRTSRCR